MNGTGKHGQLIFTCLPTVDHRGSADLGVFAAGCKILILFNYPPLCGGERAGEKTKTALYNIYEPYKEKTCLRGFRHISGCSTTEDG